MPRPRLSHAEKGNRERIGSTLRQHRLRAGLTLRAASDALNKAFSPVRISQVELGRFPYQGVIGQLAPLYGTTLEEIVREGTGQEFLDFIGTFLGVSATHEGRTECLTEKVTPEEKAELQKHLQWLRFRATIFAADVVVDNNAPSKQDPAAAE